MEDLSSPRSRSRSSPWAVDLQLKRSTPRSRTQRSTTSWKERMQERKAVFSGVAVVEDREAEEDEEEQYQEVDFTVNERKQSEIEEEIDSDVPKNTESEVEDAEALLNDQLTTIKEEIRPALTESPLMKELKPRLLKVFTNDHFLVESIADGTTEKSQKIEGDAATFEKDAVMKDLTKRVSGIYTNHHHVTESQSNTITDPSEDVKSPTSDSLSLVDANEETKKKSQDSTHEPLHLPLSEPTSEVSVTGPVTTPTKKSLSALAPTPKKDLPRSHYFQEDMRRSFRAFDQLLGDDTRSNGDDDDGMSVFTEVTIEEIVQQCVPSNSETEEKTTEFKDQMRKSFLAFENLVQAKEYDEETVIEDVLDDKSVMTEYTIDELVEQALAPNKEIVVTSATPKFQAFQKEIKKSFLAFEKLVQTEDEEQRDEYTVDESSILEQPLNTILKQPLKTENSHSRLRKESYGESTVDESITDQPPQDSGISPRKDSYDEITLEEEYTPESRERKNSADSYDEITVGDSIFEETNHHVPDQQQENRQERIQKFQNEMKKSFSAFESIILKTKDADSNGDDQSHISEYTVEAIVDQVIPSDVGNPKAFAKEMRNSFLAFESLLKEKEEDEGSIWDEQTIHESGLPTQEAKQPDVTNADNVTVLSTHVSVCSTKSGSKYAEAIQIDELDVASSNNGSSYDDAISLVDAINESKSVCQDASKSSTEGEEGEKDDNLLKNTQRFLSAIGGMVSFDNGESHENTEHTEQETLSGDTQNYDGVRQTAHQDLSYNSLPRVVVSENQPNSDEASIFNPLGGLLPEPTPTAPLMQIVAPTKVNILMNSRMFSEDGLVLPTPEKKGKNKILPVMDVEFNDGGLEDDDMTQITFDHTVDSRSPPRPPRATPKKSEDASHDDNVSTCSSQASKGIADLLRRDIWSPDVNIVQEALEKLGAEASKGASYRSYIVKFGGLLGILRAMDMYQNQEAIQLAACMTLERMALDPDTQQSIGAVGGIPVIAKVMKNNICHLQIQRAASAAVVNISCCPQEEIEGALESIILCMTKHPSDGEVQENSFKALANLSMDSPERLKELSNRGGLAAMTMALQKPWQNKAEHHEAISLLSMLLRNLAECDQ